MVVQKLSRWTLSDWTPLKVLKVQWEPSSFTYGVLPGELDADSIPSSGILNHWVCWANCEPLVVPVLFFFMVCETGISADHLQRNEKFFLFWRFAFRNGNCYLNLNRINWDSRKGEYSFFSINKIKFSTHMYNISLIKWPPRLFAIKLYLQQGTLVTLSPTLK